jgi:hypothetical protein
VFRVQSSPNLSSDHDPLYRFHQWQANLRILAVKEIKTVPYVPLSHPFVERLIGTIRRECLDPHAVLDGDGFGDEAPRFPALLQRSSHARGAGRRHAGTEHGAGKRPRACQFVSMAAALSRAVSDADGGVTRVRLVSLRKFRDS